MAKINDPTTYPATTPAASDRLIGTDVSNTTNDANGETVSFTVDSLVDMTGLHFLATADASNNATIDFTAFDSSKYDNYLFMFANIVPDTTAVSLLMRTSSDGGSTYTSSSGAYSWYNKSTVLNSTATSAEAGASATATSIELAASVGTAPSHYGVSMALRVYCPHLAKKTHFSWDGVFHDDSGDKASRFLRGAGERDTAQANDALRFYFSSGNIESGTITMYGLRNA